MKETTFYNLVSFWYYNSVFCKRLKQELSEIDIGPEMSEPLDAGEIEDDSDDEYNPLPKKIKKEKNSDEENTSPSKKDKGPKPTRFSMMLDVGQMMMDASEPRPKIKKEPGVMIFSIFLKVVYSRKDF